VVDVWICNTSPLISLARIRRLDLIESLAAEVVVPATVLREIEAGDNRDAAVTAVRSSLRLRVVPDVEVSAVVRSWQLRSHDRHHRSRRSCPTARYPESRCPNLPGAS
jgi:predicted nucleic acid-binding protein